MTEAAFLLLGAAMPLAAWAGWRVLARARWRSLSVIADLAGPAALWLLLLAATDRPLLAGLGAAAPCVFLLVADTAKRRVLGEGLLFSDSLMLPLLVRHPHLYLPFAGPRGIAAAIAAGVLAALALLLLEPAAALGAGARAGLAAVGLLLSWCLLWRPPAALLGRALRQAEADSQRLGPFATLAAHARIAALERPGRQAALAPRRAPAAASGPAPHVVLIQAESLFDPRRLNRAHRLPHWHRLAAGALRHGRLAVPGFGANTMRTEFAALTGIGDSALGLDRWNPHFRLARRPTDSLAWALRHQGYATTCLHPYDPRFFARDRVLPALGFQRFEAEAEFAGAPRAGRYVTDAAIGARIAELLREPSPQFLFAITMQAHGPWAGEAPLRTYLEQIAATDAMLGAVAEAARRAARPVLLCVYGDHLPALPEVTAAVGRDTDYLLWRSDLRGHGLAAPLAATGLRGAIAEALAAVPAALAAE